MTRRAAVAVAALALVALPASGDYEIARPTLDAGGGTSSGGAFQLTGTIGQPDTGEPSGGAFTVQGGFWPAEAGAPCPQDVNENGTVDFADVLAVIGSWGSCPGCPADVNGDDVVNFADILVILGAWGPCP
jgi:hypothetical protein